MSKPEVERVRCAWDVRGCVFEPVGLELLAQQRNVHVAVTEPGAVRGNHYHRLSSEIAVVPGPALVRFREDGRVWDSPVPDGEVHRFRIPAEVSHAFQNTGTKPMALIAFSTGEYNAARPDLIRDELI